MSSPRSAGGMQIDHGVTLICDEQGKVQAVTSSAVMNCLSGGNFVGRDFREVLGSKPDINYWIAEHITKARNAGEYLAEESIRNGTGQVFVRLESLKQNGE